MPNQGPKSSLVMPSNDDLSETDKIYGIICLSKGTLASGLPYYAYIVVKPSKFVEFYRLSAERKTIDLDDYGEVLAFATKAEPSKAVVSRMKNVYGFDERFQAVLFAELNRAGTRLDGDAEESRVMNVVAMLSQQSMGSA